MVAADKGIGEVSGIFVGISATDNEAEGGGSGTEMGTLRDDGVEASWAASC